MSDVFKQHTFSWLTVSAVSKASSSADRATASRWTASACRRAQRPRRPRPVSKAIGGRVAAPRHGTYEDAVRAEEAGRDA